MANNNPLLDSLSAFGLNSKQAKLYLTCLESGLSTVQDLAKKSGIRRTSIYSLLDDMEDMGILNVVRRKNKTFLVAQSPEMLLTNFDERREKIFRSISDLKAIHQGAVTQHPQFIFYRGREGFKNFWRDLIHSGMKEWLITTSGKEFLTFVSESYIVNWIIKEKRKLGIKSRQLISDSLYAREIIKKDKQENRESRLVDIRFPLPAIEIIYGDKVAIISSNFENMLIVIESKDVAQTHRSYFEMIWESIARPSAY